MALFKKDVLQNAEKLVRKGKIEAAIKEYKKVVEKSPGDTNTLNRIGDLYVRLRKNQEAVDYYLKTAERFALDGFYVKAIAVYKKVQRIDPGAVEVHGRLADLYAKQGLTNDARNHYGQLADHHLRNNDTSAAIATYERLVDLDPENPTPLLRLADLYREDSRRSEATKTYGKIANVLIERGQVDHAIQVYDRALQLEGGNLDFVSEAVLKIRDAGGEKRAMDLVSRAEKHNPAASTLRNLVSRPRIDPDVGSGPLDSTPSSSPSFASEVAGQESEKEPSAPDFAEGQRKWSDEISTSLDEDETPSPALVDPSKFSEEPPPPTIGGESEAEAVEPVEASAEESSAESPPAPPSPPEPPPAPESFSLEDEGPAESQVEPPPEVSPGSEVSPGEGSAEESGEFDLGEIGDISAEAIELDGPGYEEEYQAEFDAAFDRQVDPGPVQVGEGAGDDAPEVVADLESAAEEAPAAAPEPEREPVPSELPSVEAPGESPVAAEPEPAPPAAGEGSPTEPPAPPSPPPAPSPPDQPPTAPSDHAPVPPAQEPPAPSAPPQQAADEPPAELEEKLSEAGVFRKYGLLDKALDRLNEILAIAPDHLEAMSQAIQVLVEREDESRAATKAETLLLLCAQRNERDLWNETRELLETAGYQIEGDRVRTPGELRVESGSVELPAADPLDVADEAASRDDDDDEGDDFSQLAREPLEVEQGDDHDMLDSKEIPVQTRPPAADETAPEAGEEAAAARSLESADADGTPNWLDEKGDDEGSEATNLFDDEADFFDLAAELQDELGTDLESLEESLPENASEQSLEEIVEGFKRGVQENISEEESDTHYNLGIAYREMMLVDEAIHEFQISAKSPDYFIDSCAMLGLCFREKGHPDLAAKWYQRALDAEDLTLEQRVGTLYELGDTLEASGDSAGAEEAFSQLVALSEDFRDVSERLAGLQGAQA